MNIEEYILNRIANLKTAKQGVIANPKMHGAKDVLLEINTRLAELESIAVRFNFALKDNK